MCEQPNGEPLNISKKGTLTLRVSASGTEQVLNFTDVYYAKGVVHNLISYGKLDEKGFALSFKGGRRVVAAKDGGRVVFDVDLRRNVLEAAGPTDESVKAQKANLVKFHRRLGHRNYAAVERLARDPSAGIVLTEHRRANCLTCAEGKQSRNTQSTKDSGEHAPTDRVGGVICSDLKDRLGNRYMINFVDHKSNYCAVFLAKTKDAAGKKFEHYIVYVEKRYGCRIHVLRTVSGGDEAKRATKPVTARPR
ncbi:hypothetical protein PI124_g12485 [Phytophthora idaei]|nr:hypothetical protein PI124_g12485 [Phytophthora idaei]